MHNSDDSSEPSGHHEANYGTGGPRLSLRHREQNVKWSPADVAFHSARPTKVRIPRSAPISPRTRVQPIAGGCNGIAAIKRSKNAQHPARMEERLDELISPRTDAMRAWGSPATERAPRKLAVGYETRFNENDTHGVSLELSTIYAYTLQNLFHFHYEAWKRNVSQTCTHQE
jgi:hypothetical protein